MLNTSLLVFLAVMQTSTSGPSGREAEIIKALNEPAEEEDWGYVPLSGPQVDMQHSGNVTAQVGKTAILNCRILYIAGKTVTWIRTRDLHLLTINRFTYTSDDRFKAIHQAGSSDWLLKIHYVQFRDAGRYECQVSTTPPLIHSVWLTVVEPKTTILGVHDLYIDSGSTLNLTCVVKFSPQPPAYIFWYQNDQLLSYDTAKTGVHVSTEHGEGKSLSRLLITKADSSHSGKYKCLPANAPAQIVTVHVIHNDEPAAIHHKNTTTPSAALPSLDTSASPSLLSFPPSDSSSRSSFWFSSHWLFLCFYSLLFFMLSNNLVSKR